MATPLFSPAREQRVLSFINLDGAPALQLCAERGITADTFYGSKERTIYEIATELHRDHQLTDGGSILGEEVCIKRNAVSTADFVALTSQIPAYGVYLAELPELCRELKRLEKQRALKIATDVLSQAIKDGDQEKVTSSAAAINSTDLSSRPRVTWHQTGGVELDRARAIIEGKEDPDVRSINWPWRGLDLDLKPFQRGESVVVAGYTSNGKSSLLRQFALSAASRGLNVAFVSMEVRAPDIFNLMASAQSGQPWSRLKNIHPRDQEDFMRAGQQVRGMSMEILDDERSLPAILAWLRNQYTRRFLDVIAVDYLGLVADCKPKDGETKAAAVGDVACAFKSLAMELQVVLFLAVQINRGPTKEGNREPRLSDLKDSGDIEAHADRVLLLFRPDTDKETETDQATHQALADRRRFYMELFQEKGRNVGTGSAALYFNRELARFEPIS